MINFDELISHQLEQNNPKRHYESSSVEDIVNEDAVNEMLEALVGKQRQINTQKAMRKAYDKTNSQVKRYLSEIFGNKSEEDMRRAGAFLMLYTQKFGAGATFLGFQRFIKSNRFKATEDIANEYIGLVMKDDMNNVYDILEQFQQQKEERLALQR